MRVARQYVPTQEIAEDVAQEAWLGLLRGLDTFEGRSSLRTYLFRIVMNLARTRGVREARSAPFSSLARDDEDGPSVDPERFVRRPQPRRGALGLADPPVERQRRADRALGRGGRAGLRGDRELPETQRRVVTLRDVEGFGAGRGERPARPLGRQPARAAAPRRARSCARRSRSTTHERADLAQREPTCQELAELVTDYLEGALARRRSTRSSAPHRRLPQLHAYVEQMRTTIAVTRRIRAEDIPAERARRAARRLPRLGAETS